MAQSFHIIETASENSPILFYILRLYCTTNLVKLLIDVYLNFLVLLKMWAGKKCIVTPVTDRIPQIKKKVYHAVEKTLSCFPSVLIFSRQFPAANEQRFSQQLFVRRRCCWSSSG